MTQATPASPAPLDYQTPRAPGIGERTSRGFVWSVGQTLVTKAVSIGGQVALAWLLAPADFGLVGLAYAVAAFPSLLRDAGLQQILVQRHLHFRRWAGPVFWMSMALGLASGVLLAAGAPLATIALNAPGLTGLLWVLALSLPINALSTVPAAKVQADLRYRFQAVLGLVLAVGSMGLSILLAYLGFGPYSFVVPYLITSAGRTVALWTVERPRMRWRWQFRRWRYLTGDSGVLLVTAGLGMLVTQGDYLILGWFHDPVTVGLFYFAFNLSMQSFVLLSVNLGGVLFPALSKLEAERPRQVAAFIRATRGFVSLAIPFCLLQCVLSPPGVRLLFNAKWLPVVPVLQILSIAMAMRSVSLPAAVLAAAQGRYRFNLVAAVVSAVGFLGTVALAAGMSSAAWAPLVMALAEAVFFLIYDTSYLWLVLRANGRSYRESLQIWGVPMLSSVAAAAAAWLVVEKVPLPQNKVGDATRLALGTIAFLAVYLPLLRVTAVDVWKELMTRMRTFI